MSNFNISRYEWVLEVLPSAACVTVVRGLDVAGVVEALGGDPAAAPEPLERFVAAGTYVELAAVRPVGDVVVAVEPGGGFQGSRPEVIRRASRQGLAVSVYWNEVKASLSRYAFAQDGELVGTYEPGYDRIADAFVRAERATGVRLRPEDLAGIADVWRLLPVLEDLRPAPALRYHPLWRHDRGRAQAVAAATPARQREMALEAAARAAAASGLDREPGVAEVLATGRMTPEVTQLVRRLQGRSWAALALYSATNPDPLAAALDAIRAADQVS